MGTRLASFDDLSIAALRRRRSEKWGRYSADILPMTVAEMDFPLAPSIRRLLSACIEEGDCGYVDPTSHDLGISFAAYAAKEWAWTVDPAAVIPVADVMAGVAEVLRRLTRPGDSVVITPPVYPPFFATVREVGCRVSEAPLAWGDGRVELDLDAIDRAFTAGAGVLLLCNPHNPTGRVFNARELRAVAELAARRSATVIVDEIHSPLTLGRSRHQPFVALGDDAARYGITVTSISKAWNVAGLKCAIVVAADGPMRGVLEDFPQDACDRVGYLGWLASCCAWTDEGSWLNDVRFVLRRNRQLLGDLLAAELPEVRWIPPEAGYLAWLDCRPLGFERDPSEVFREHGLVALSPGPSFGADGHGYARLNFATSASILREAVQRMATGAEVYSSQRTG